MLSFLQQAARLHRKAAAKDEPLSAVLAVILCVSLASPAFAAEIGYEGAVRQMAAREIESETERIMEIVYDQLSEQDALSLLPAFESIVTSMVEADVNQKYGIAPTALETYSYELPNGGAIGYEGPFQTTCVNTYLTDEQYNEIEVDIMKYTMMSSIGIANQVKKF